MKYFFTVCGRWNSATCKWNKQFPSGDWFLRTSRSLKKTPTQILSCEICKLFKNNYFEEHVWMSDSKLYWKRDSNTGVFSWISGIIKTAGSEAPVQGSLFNKVASLTTWTHLTLLGRDSSTVISLWILWNF